MPHLNRSSRPTLSLIAAASLLLVSGVAGAPGDGVDPFRRLGGPDRLVEVRALETRAFDPARLAGLASWSGDPITTESLDGKVLVLLAWDQREARSVRLLPTLSRLERTMGDSVVALAVHTQEGWDDAKHRIDAGRVPVASAHDADGAFFDMLNTAAHPNLYVIDKAGQIRLADLDPRDLARAVGTLSRETKAQATADLPNRIERLAEARRLIPNADPAHDQGVQPGTDMPNPDAGPRKGDPAAGPGRPAHSAPPPMILPESPEATPRPPASAYTAAAWHSVNNTNRLNAINMQGKPLTVALGNETWLTEKPERAVNEHVLVLDFWATWCGPCIRASPLLDELQTRHAGDLLVLGMAGQAAGSRYPEDERAIRAFIASHPVSYSHLHDAQKRVYRSLNITAIPHVLVISTDGVVRWQGNPHDPAFRRAVDATVQADPLLAARRAQRPGNG